MDAQQPKCDAANAAVTTAQNEKNAADQAVKEAEAAVKAAKEALEASKADAKAQIAKGSKGFFEKMNATKALEELNTDYKIGDTPLVNHTHIGADGDATSLENMLKALDYIDQGNGFRTAGDNNFGSMDALRVTDQLMALAQINANGSAITKNHTNNWGVLQEVGRSGENLAWSLNPYDGWYNAEKHFYDDNGGPVSYSDNKKAKYGYWIVNTTGHYESLMKREFLYTGFGFGSNPMANIQQFRTYTAEESYSVSEYRERLLNYYAPLKETAAKGTTDAQTALNAAQVTLVAKQAAQKTAETNLQNAKDNAAKEAKNCEACQKALDEAEAALNNAKAAVPAAEQALKAAKEAANNQNGVVENKATELDNAEKAKAAADEAVTQAQDGVNAKQQAADDAQKTVDEKQKALDVAKENYDAVVATKADAKKQLDEAENAVKQADAALNTAKDEKAKADAAVADAATKLNEAKQKAAEAETRAQDAQKAKDTADQKAADAKTANDAAAKDYADKAAAQKAADEAQAKADAAAKPVEDAQKAKDTADQEAVDANTAKETAQKAKDQAAVDNEGAQKVPDLDTWIGQQPGSAPAPVAPLSIMAMRAPAATSVSAETQQAIDDVLAKYQAYLEAAQAADTATEEVQQLEAAYKEAKAALAPFEAALQQANTQLDKAKATYEKLYQDCIAPGSAYRGKHAGEPDNASRSGLGKTGADDLSTILGLSAISAGAGAYLVARRRQPKHAR